MELTDDEQKMLDGGFGQGVSEAMRIQVALGEAFGAERMVEITRAHEAYGPAESCAWFLELFSNSNTHCRVPITCNPRSDAEYLKSIGLPVLEDEARLIMRVNEARRRIGVIPTDCCTPYLQDNVPRMGEIIAFAESSATPYVNSVCGARSHRESTDSALAAAITGRVPLYGLMLDENRKGEILVKVEATLRDDFDYHLLGYAIGSEAGAGIPVFSGMASSRPSPEELTSLGAQLATSGAVAMYHIVGVTPEAPDMETAFGEKSPRKEVSVNDDDLRETRESISVEEGRIDFVMFGCPHYSINQIRDTARLLEGKAIKKGVQLWVLASSSTRELARRMGYLDVINKAGGDIVAGTCSDMMCWEQLYRGKVGMTDSPKAYYYDLHRGINFIVKRRSECIEAALKGEC